MGYEVRLHAQVRDPPAWEELSFVVLGVCRHADGREEWCLDYLDAVHGEVRDDDCFASEEAALAAAEREFALARDDWRDGFPAHSETAALIALGSTPLYAAAVAGNAEEVRALLAAGADPDEESRGSSDGTPLCGAACWGYEDAVRALLDGGADPNLAESDGFLPLQWAVSGLHHGTAAALLEAGADPNAACAPLVMAADHGSVGLVRLLLDHGADPGDGAALAAAAAKAGTDVERALIDGMHGDGPVEVRREPRPGGCELVEVSRRTGSGRQISTSEDGHAQIAALLRGA